MTGFGSKAESIRKVDVHLSSAPPAHTSATRVQASLCANRREQMQQKDGTNYSITLCGREHVAARLKADHPGGPATVDYQF